MKPHRIVLQLPRALPLATGAVTLMASAVAHAQLLENLTIGNPRALALGHAVTADPPGIDSIHYNPAGLQQIKGQQYNVKLLVASQTTDVWLGEPTRPDDATKQAFYDLVQDTQCADTTSIDDCWGYDPLANTSGTADSPSLYIPLVGMTDVPIIAMPMGGIAFEDRNLDWTFGTAAFLHHGIGYRHSETSPARYQGERVGITRLTYFAPTIAVPVNERLSLGFGLNLSYQGFFLDSSIRAPLESTRFLGTLSDTVDPDLLPALAGLSVLNPYDDVGQLEIDMDDFLSIGFNFGLLYDYNPWLTLGLSYHSEAVSELRGDFRMENSAEFYATTSSLHAAGLDILFELLDGTTFNARAVETGKVELEYIVPQSLALGASIQVTNRLRFNVDLKWTEYSVWNSLDFKFSRKVDYLNFSSVINTLQESSVGDNADPDEMRLPRNYRDVWSWAFGLEYQWNDRWQWRFGFEPRKTAIPGDSTDLFFPLGDLNLFAAGFGYQASDVTKIDVGIAFGQTEVSTSACESRNANSCVEGDVIYNPYFSQPFKTSTDILILNVSYDRKF